MATNLVFVCRTIELDLAPLASTLYVAASDVEGYAADNDVGSRPAAISHRAHIHEHGT